MADFQTISKLNPHVSVDCVIFGFDNNDLKVLLIEQFPSTNSVSDRGSMALPGNLIKEDEDLDDAAKKACNSI